MHCHFVTFTLHGTFQSVSIGIIRQGHITVVNNPGHNMYVRTPRR